MSKISYDTVYKTAWLLCIITLPLPTQVTSFFSLVLIAVWLADVRLRDKWQRLKASYWVLPFIIFFALHLVGVTYSEHVSDGFFEVEKKLAFLSLPIIAASGRPLTKSDFSFLKSGFVYACFAIVVISFASGVLNLPGKDIAAANFDPLTDQQFRLFNPGSSPLWERLSYIEAGSWIELHPGYFSMYLIFAIIILAQRMIDEMKVNFISLSFTIVFTLFLSLLASRMAIIAYIVILFCLPVFNAISKGHHKVILIPALSIALLLSLIWINPVSRFRILQEPVFTLTHMDERDQPWNSVNYRFMEWQASISELRQSWIAGVGSGDGQAALTSYYSRYGDDVVALNYNTHNQYFQTTLELGVPGIIALLVCIFLPAVKAAQRYPEHVSFILLFAMMCCTESMLSAQKGIVFFAIFQSLYLRCNQS